MTTMTDETRQIILAACKAVRETPLGDGRTVWDLLTDERSRRAVEIAERYADGDATDEELAAAAREASAAAWAAADVAQDATWAAAWAASTAADAAMAAAAGTAYAAVAQAARLAAAEARKIVAAP